MTTATKAAHLPTIRRSEEYLADDRVYVILWGTNTRWSETTGLHDSLEAAYAEARQIVARQFRIPADAEIRDWHGVWNY